jgi:hypothetical protein
MTATPTATTEIMNPHPEPSCSSVMVRALTEPPRLGSASPVDRHHRLRLRLLR